MIGELGREVGEAISKVCKTLLRLPVTKRTWFVRPPLGGNATDPWRGGARPPAEPVVEAPPFWKDIEPGYVDSQKDGPVGSDGH